MSRLNKKGITEATIYYIMAIALGITVVVVYILLVGPGTIVTYISNFFGGFLHLVTGGLSTNG